MTQAHAESMIGRSRKMLVLDRAGGLTTDLADAAVGIENAPEVLRLRRSSQVLDACEVHRPDVVVAGPEEMTHTGLRRLARVHRAFLELAERGTAARPYSVATVSRSAASIGRR